MSIRSILWIALGCAALFGTSKAHAVSQQEFNSLQQEIEELRNRLVKKNAAPTSSAPIARTDSLIENRYGPNAKVTTKEGAMTIGGVFQIWQYWIRNDNINYDAVNRKSNELADNDGMRIRKAELRFGYDVTPDISAVLMIDPTGGDENNTFPSFPSNQGLVGYRSLGGFRTNQGQTLNELGGAGTYPGVFGVVTNNGVANTLGFQQVVYASGQGVPIASYSSSSQNVFESRFESGETLANRFVQDAYINYHPQWIKNTDFTIGQFKAPVGEEGNRNSGQLDFVERAMVNQFSNERDMGLMVHGSWWEGKFQYWLAALNAPGSFHSTFASFQNRSDDNDEKDVALKLMLRPIWQKGKWGSLEFGYSRQDGIHGEGGNGYYNPPALPPGVTLLTNFPAPSINGLSMEQARAYRNWAWVWYRPGGPVKGWWLRGEYGNFKDRPLPGTGQFVAGQFVLDPAPVKREGWYAATGYRMSESIFAENLKGGGFIKRTLHDCEFTYRYEKFANIMAEDLVQPIRHTDIFSSRAQTFGINVYWKGYNFRTQLNYVHVTEPDGHYEFVPGSGYAVPIPRIREVSNDAFVISHQISF